MNYLTPHFQHPKIAVIGDVMVDKFAAVKFARPSAEDVGANCYQEIEVTRIPGGIGTTARVITNFGGTAELFGVAGGGSGARELGKELERLGITDKTVRDTNGRPTTFKTRFVDVATNRQIMVHERQTRDPIADWIKDALLSRLRESAAVAFVVSDFDRGVVTPAVARGVCDIAKESGRKVVFDARPRLLSWYEANTHDLFLFKGNLFEFEQMLERPIRTQADLDGALDQVCGRLQCNVMITRSQHGMTVGEVDGGRFSLPANNPSPTCVAGAGDTVAATVAMAVTSGHTLREACELASMAASITCAKPGTEVATLPELMEAFEK